MESILQPDLKDRRVLLAVCGGIAAYKAAELCRLMIRSGARVDVMMTAAARGRSTSPARMTVRGSCSARSSTCCRA